VAVAEKGDAHNDRFRRQDRRQRFEGGKSENFDLTLGSGAFVPGLKISWWE